MKTAAFFIMAFLLSCGSRQSAPDRSASDTTSHLQEKDSLTGPAVTSMTGKARQVNQWLRAAGADSLELTTDTVAAWPKDVFDYFIAAKRAKDPDYPYIATGDFNGDGLTDHAALVKHTGKPVYEIAVISGDSTDKNRIRSWKEDIDICAISLYPKGELAGMDQPPVKMRGDGINVEYYEKASFVIYWDGKEFRRTYTGD